MSDRPEDLTTIITSAPTSEKRAPKKAEPCLVLLTGGPVGMMYHLILGGEMIIGRADDAHIRLEDKSVSRRHAKITTDHNRVVTVEDLGSTNGTLVNGERVDRYAVKDGDKIEIGPNAVFRFCYQDDIERSYHEELYIRGIKDGLTGAHNKQYFLDRIEAEYVHAQRSQKNLVVLIFDIDHFKKINDTFGHPAGDYVLRQIVTIVSPILRAEDVFARFGGDEFAILTRNVTDAGAVVLAQRIRRTINHCKFDFDGNHIRVTVSLGIGTLSDKVKDAADLIKVADRYLYKAKLSGKNCLIGGPAIMTTLQEITASHARKHG